MILGRLPKRPQTVNCKICGRDNVPFSAQSTSSRQMIEYDRVVYQYTKGPSCTICKTKFQHFLVYKRSEGLAIDTFIVNRLLVRMGITYSAAEKYTTEEAKKRRAIALKNYRESEHGKKSRKEYVSKNRVQHNRDSNKSSKKYRRRKAYAKSIKINVEYFKTKLIQSNGSYYEWDNGAARSNTEYQGCRSDNMLFANRPRTTTFRLRLGTKAI